jgi:adenosine/AMP kinase
MQLTTIRVDKPDATYIILGQTHFIKSVEDIHEALVGAALAHTTDGRRRFSMRAYPVNADTR